MTKLPLALSLAFALVACERQPLPQDGERLSLEAVRLRHELPLASPDTRRAVWTVAAGGKAVNFGTAGRDPLLTLVCELEAERPQLAIIRHASALPGQKALLAVMGNGEVARLPADAQRVEGEWQWIARLPAADPRLNLFIGSGDMRATLPGKGAVAMAPDPVPGQFVNWCRAGGRS